MQTDDAHSPRELWFDGKAIDIKGCISTEGRRMWENLRQRPVDLLLRTRTPQFFPRNPPGILRLKNAYYPRSSRIAGGKDPWRRLRDLAEESYWLIRGVRGMNHWMLEIKLYVSRRERKRSIINITILMNSERRIIFITYKRSI